MIGLRVEEGELLSSQGKSWTSEFIKMMTEQVSLPRARTPLILATFSCWPWAGVYEVPCNLLFILRELVACSEVCFGQLESWGPSPAQGHFRALIDQRGDHPSQNSGNLRVQPTPTARAGGAGLCFRSAGRVPPSLL